MASLSSGFSVGSGSSSALLKSAGGVARAKADYEDKLMAFKWNTSAKTEEDWNEYSSYLDDRATKLSATGTLSDTSKALSLTTTQVSSQRTFTSAAIQRSSIGILEGNGTLQDKANAIASFYEMASNNGDMQLAQTLRYQFDQVDTQIQYQANQARDLAEKMVKMNVTSVGAYMDTMKSNLKQFSNQFSEFGAKGLDALSKEYKKTLEAQGVVIPTGKNPSIWDIANGVVSNMISTLDSAISVYGPVDAATLVRDYQNIVNGDTSFKIGGISVTYDELQDAVAAANAGQQWAVPVVQGGKTVLVKNKEQSYMWGKDPATGQYRIVTGYSPQGADLGRTGSFRINEKGEYLTQDGTIVAKKGKNGQVLDSSGKAFKDEASLNRNLQKAEFSYDDLLKSAGFNVRNVGGKMYVSGTEETKDFFKIPGLEQGQDIQVLKGANGQLRFVAPADETGRQRLYGVSFDNSKGGRLSSLFEVNPLSDIIPGFAGEIQAPRLVDAARGLQLQRQQEMQIAQLEQSRLQNIANLQTGRLQTTPVNVQPAANPQQPLPVAQVVQPAATVQQIQNAQNNIQRTDGGNINQSGARGVQLTPNKQRTIPL